MMIRCSGSLLFTGVQSGFAQVYFNLLRRGIYRLTHSRVQQTICGMSVVGGDWENLKRYNLAEIYQQATKRLADFSGNTEAKATPGRVSKDEAQSVAEEGTIKLE